MSIPSNWSTNTPKWDPETYNLLMAGEIKNIPSYQNMEQFLKSSDTFPIKFPIDTGRCKTLRNQVDDVILQRNINSVYPLMHESALELCCKFILFKRKYGSCVEKALYKNINLLNFIDRLLKKRCVMFMGKMDLYVLLNGRKGFGDWDTIGTEYEKGDLTLENCLSFDEIKLSAFLSVSSYTYFINSGDRNNVGHFYSKRNDIEDEGVIVGIIGPRLDKINSMEYQDIVISKTQNTSANGYGGRAKESVRKLFSEFYCQNSLDFNELIDFKSKYTPQRFVKVAADSYFDNHAYYKRLCISFDTLLLEANERAMGEDREAFVFVVGFGLGVWSLTRHQEKVFMDAFARRIACLGQYLNNVSDICFSYINQEYCGAYRNGDTFPIKDHPRSGIKIHITRRNPHQKLRGADAGKLLVVSYPWDGNALPGNEYWNGMLKSTGDSAAACSTQITEIHNAHINALVCAENMRVVTNHGLITLQQYRKLISCENKIR